MAKISTVLIMHQHPRSPAPPVPSRSNSNRPYDPREQDVRANSPTVDSRPNTGRGLGIATEPSEQVEKSPAPSKEAMGKLNQIISVCLVILTLWKDIANSSSISCRTIIQKPL